MIVSPKLVNYSKRQFGKRDQFISFFAVESAGSSLPGMGGGFDGFASDTFETGRPGPTITCFMRAS